MPKHHTTTTTKPPPRPPRPPSTKSSYSFTKQRSRPTSRSYKEQSVSSVMQNAHDIVFKRQWPTITAPTSLNSPRTSATTAFFKMDQRNMKKVAPVKIVLPDQVKRNIENNMKKKQQRMMLGTLIPSVGNSKGYYKGKKSADQNQHRMRISAPAAGKNRSKGASAQSSLQNRFASRRSYIPMAQETPDMREVRIERHRKKQLSQQGKRSQQIAIQKLSQRHHHTSRIEAVARRNRFNHNNEESQNSKQKDGVGTAKPGHHSMEELEKNKTEESEDGNRQMQVLSALMKRVADSSKFFADENIARSVMTEVDQDEMGGLRRGFDMNPGGLTLPQFIELMLGFVPISEEEEHEIQEMHQHHHHHLHHKHHHRHHTNMGQVVHVKGKSRLQLARNLCELFEQIDINGDGTLEWDEFTSYCVSQGLANDKKPGGAIKRYKLLRTYNCYNQGIGVIDNMESFVLNGDEWDMTKANIMRMARVNPKRVTSLTSGKNNYRSDKEKHQAGMTLITCDRNAIHMGTFSIRSPRTGKLLKRCGDGVHKNSILAICYIPCMELIVTSSADLTLGFWDSHKYDLRQLMPVDEEMLALHWVNSVDAGLRSENSVANRNNLNPNSNRGGKNEKNIGSNQDDEQKRKKTSLLERFSSGIRVGTLYTGDVEGKITAWNVANMFVEASLEGHTDSVTSFLSIATLRLLVSSSMDSTVRIWNLRSNAPLKVLRGHSRGVSSVAFSSEQRVLLSCGFDHEIFVWNPYVETRTSGKLRGHTCSILSVKCVEGTKEAISVDIEGNLRVWDLRTLQCVQILAAHEAAGGADEHLYDHVNNPNTPNPDMFKDVSEKGGDCLSWCYVHHPDGNRIMVSTERQLRVYAYDEVTDPRVADANVSNALVYNPLTSSFLTAGGQTCKNWDAATGKLLHTFENIIEEDKVEITALCYDDQYRQFLLGDTMGRIRMYQCSNGQLLRNLVSHSDGGEVVAIMFNRVTDCIYSSSSKGQLIAQEDDGEGTDEQNAEDDAIVPPLDPNNEEGINVGREAGELFRKTRHDLIHLFTSKYAPPCEVTSLVQGPTLGLLAWGGADGDVVIIDCITGHTEGMCVPATTGTIALKARIPVTALTFLEPYPLLAVSYGDGSICIWSVRPFYIRQCPLMIFYNYKRPKIHLSPALAASAPWIFKKQVHPSGETVDVLKMCWDISGKCLFAGDSNGSILKWNLRYMLLKLRIRKFKLDDDSDQSTDINPKKLSEVLHPDLKRTTMSPREKLEELLAASPRVFEDNVPEESITGSEDKTEIAGLSWLGKVRRRASATNVKKRGFVAVQAAVRIKGQEGAALTELISKNDNSVANSTFELTEVTEDEIKEDKKIQVAENFLHLLASGGTSASSNEKGDQKSEDSKGLKVSRQGLHTAASKRTYCFRSYAKESRTKSKLQYGKLLSGDSAQLVDAKPCHHDAVCNLHILTGLRAIASSGQDHAVVVRSLDAEGGTLESDDEDDNIEADELDVLGRLWQGFPDPKWKLGPLVKKQMELNLSYELKRASAILKYMDDRNDQYEKITKQFFAPGNSRRRDIRTKSSHPRKQTMAMMLGTKAINGEKIKVVKFKKNEADGSDFSGIDSDEDDNGSTSDSSSSSSSDDASSVSSYQTSIVMQSLKPNSFKEDAIDEDRRFQALNPESSKVNGPASHRDLGPKAGINGVEMLRLVLTEGVRPPRDRKARFRQANIRLKRVARYMRIDKEEEKAKIREEKAKARKAELEKAIKEEEDVESYVRRKSIVSSTVHALMKKSSTAKKDALKFIDNEEREKKKIASILKNQASRKMSIAERRQSLAHERAAEATKKIQGSMHVLW